MPSARSVCGIQAAVVLIALIFIITAGCSAPEQPSASAPTSPLVTTTPLPGTPALTTAVVTTSLAPAIPVTPTVTITKKPANTKVATTAPVPAPTLISDSALNARIVDARNKLEMFIDSDVADTVIIHTGPPQNCEVKKSRELGYLIDINTGNSTFVKGDYWSIDARLFSNPMRKDHQYVIIHTHPRMWVTCAGSGVYSLYTFSIGDLEAVANMTQQGYHVKKLFAIADKEYQIWPAQDDGWKSSGEIRQAVRRVESQVGRPFSYYDPVFGQTFYDVDSLMPLLVKELDYHYSANNNIIN